MFCNAHSNINLKQIEVHESKQVEVECRYLKLWDLLSVLNIFHNPSLKMTTSFVNIARNEDRTNKYKNLARKTFDLFSYFILLDVKYFFTTQIFILICFAWLQWKHFFYSSLKISEGLKKASVSILSLWLSKIIYLRKTVGPFFYISKTLFNVCSNISPK